MTPSFTTRTFIPKERKEGSREALLAGVPWTETTKIQIGRFCAEMSWGADGHKCVWDPHMPRRGEFSPQDLKKYQAARDELMQRAADRLGGAILLLE
jgi:hypothetical protein